jgi:hypothetical protein
MLVDVNEVSDNRPEGGLLALQDAKRARTSVTFVGPRDDAQRKWILENMIRSLKHDADKHKTHRRVDVYPMNKDESTLCAVISFLEAREKSRGRPSTTPRSTTEVLKELMDEIDAADGLMSIRGSTSTPSSSS